MIWECWQIVYEARSPIHIGYHTIGNIQLTRYYIPGKNFWGAATARLANMIKPLDYLASGDFVRDNIIFSYFYPSIDVDTPFLPKFSSKNDWMYGTFQEEVFEYNCIGSIAGTAISSNTNAALDGSLHEVEYINYRWRTDGVKPILFTGFLFIKKGATHNGICVGWDSGDLMLCEILEELSIGGERRYGFGMMRLTDRNRRVGNNGLLWKLWEIKLNNDIIKVKAMEDETPLLAHCKVTGINAKGALEPVIGREWASASSTTPGRGAGQNIRWSGICWVPGSTVKENTVLSIGSYGIWQQ